jgi:hypothetical protein
MRKLLLLALLIGSSTIAIAQDTYYILAVKGKILNRNSNQYLKARQKIKSSDKVIFKDKNAKALIYSRGKGRFNLTLSPQNKKSPNELVVLVKKSIFAQQQGAFTRGFYDDYQELQEDFKRGTPHYIVLNNRLELNFSSQFMTSISSLGKGVFFIRYQYEGKPRNIGLTLKDRKLIITKESLFKTKEGEWLDPSKASDMYLAFYKQEAPKGIAHLGENESKLMFSPLFLSSKDLDNIGLPTLVKVLKEEKASKKKIIDEIRGLLTEFKGTTDKSNVETWYNQNFK